MRGLSVSFSPVKSCRYTGRNLSRSRYADSTGVEYVALVGENEIAAEKITLKNMTTGEQSLFTIDEVIALFA